MFKGLVRPASATALLALACLSLIWGYNFVVMKTALDYIDPLDFTAARTLLGALSLFAFAGLTGRSLVMPPWRVMVVTGLLQTALFSLLIQWALVGAEVGRTVVVVYSMPFWLAVLAALFLNEPLGRVRLIVVALAGCGLILLVQPWQLDLASGGGPLLALSAGLVWAIAAVVIRRAPKTSGQTLLSLTAWQLLVGAVVLCAFALMRPSEPPRMEPYLLWSLLYGSVFATGIAWALWLLILDRMSAGGAGFSTLLVPVVGLLASWIQLGERLDGLSLVGIGLVLCGLIVFAVIGLRAAAKKERSLAAAG